MGIFQGDVVIRNTILEGLKQLRKDPYLIEDIFQQFILDPTLRQEYGFKEVQNAKNFILNNKIEVVMRHRKDNVTHPYISIALLDSREKENRAFLSDIGPDFQDFDPKEIDQPIDFVIGPFTPKSYDPTTGTVVLPDNLDTSNVVANQALADSVTGEAVIIKVVKDDKTMIINSNVSFKFNKLVVIPQFFFYRTRRALTYFRERYQIGCHIHGEPYQLLYLHAAIVFILMRNKEDLLEKRGFEISTFSSTDIVSSENFVDSKENAYSRYITLEGDVEFSWPLSPGRIIESITREDGLSSSGLRIIDENGGSFKIN